MRRYIVYIFLFSLLCFYPWLTNKLPPFSDASFHAYTLDHFRLSLSNFVFPKWDKNLGMGYPYLLWYHGPVVYYILAPFALVFGTFAVYNSFFFVSGFLSLYSIFLLLDYLKIDRRIALITSALFSINWHVLTWISGWMGNYSMLLAYSLCTLTTLFFLKLKKKKDLIYSLLYAFLLLTHAIIAFVTTTMLIFALIFKYIQKKNLEELKLRLFFIAFGVLIASVWYVPSIAHISLLKNDTFFYGSQHFNFLKYFIQFNQYFLVLTAVSCVYLSINYKKIDKICFLFIFVYLLSFLLIMGFFVGIINLIPFARFVQQAWRWAPLHLMSGCILVGYTANDVLKKFLRKNKKKKILIEMTTILILLIIFYLNRNNQRDASLQFSELPGAWLRSSSYLKADKSFYRILSLPNTCGSFNVIQQSPFFHACHLENQGVSPLSREFKKKILDKDSIFHHNWTNLLQFSGVKYVQILNEFFIPYFDFLKLKENERLLNLMLQKFSKDTNMELIGYYISGPLNTAFVSEWGINSTQLYFYKINKEPLRYFFAKKIVPIGECHSEVINFLLQNPMKKEVNFWFSPNGTNCEIDYELKEMDLVNKVIFSEGLENFDIVVDMKEDAYLVINENNMLGWNAKIDDKRKEILTAYPSFIMLKVPSGRHSIEIYQSFTKWHYLGIVISLISLSALLCLYRKNRYNK